MTIDSGSRAVRVPDDVLVRPVGDEMVLLNATTERYFGLDPVGASMWKAITTTESLEAAVRELQKLYSGDPEELAADLDELVQKLIDQGLLALPEE